MPRQCPLPTPTFPPSTRPLRVVAVRMLFLTHTPSLPSHPSPAKTTRAYEYVHSRGGSAPSIFCVLSRLHVDKCWLVASLGEAQEAQVVTRELEADGMNTRYCKVWGGAGVPTTWVLHAGNTNSQSVINHNPLPGILREEFVSLMGPPLVSEHCPSPESPVDSPTLSPPPLSPNNGAPFETRRSRTRATLAFTVRIQRGHWLACEARHRSDAHPSLRAPWSRTHPRSSSPTPTCSSSTDTTRKRSPPRTPAPPRAFLLALTRLAPPHALLVAYWGADGAAALSVPTWEYFQSSGWSAPSTPAASAASPSSPLSATTNPSTPGRHHPRSGEEAQSQRVLRLASTLPRRAVRIRIDSDCTESAGGSSNDGPRAQGPAGQSPASGVRGKQQAAKQRADDVGAHDALTAGMVYALSCRVLPGAPYVPGLAGSTEAQRTEGGRWKLDECLRLATELAGRRARRRAWDGLGEEMARAGWFDA
ncbi:hypothetical protein EDB92DRAFT_1953174 [Lactarius akahatsu]|uniref:Carbohydrate kinase PfkB domain-containing protein n=1 Tax=Lactarius akahatsu TaxID=416441 RepID=A0AAD4Q8R4_9AGAM|nr:hypothetical protein EDB92DRAFT_1953174 [Lactarius akahatsu]